MKFSSKVKKCGLSPMRKFHPYAVAAEQAGKEKAPPARPVKKAEPKRKGFFGRLFGGK